MVASFDEQIVVAHTYPRCRCSASGPLERTFDRDKGRALRGAGTHDVNFILPLVERVRGTFALRYVLPDKAYLSENVVGRL